jgi:hypothetical protein
MYGTEIRDVMDMKARISLPNNLAIKIPSITSRAVTNAQPTVNLTKVVIIAKTQQVNVMFSIMPP